MTDYRKQNAPADDLDGSLASAPETGADSTSIRQAHADFLIQRLEVNYDMIREDCFSLALRSLAAMIDWLLASQMRKPEFR